MAKVRRFFLSSNLEDLGCFSNSSMMYLSVTKKLLMMTSERRVMLSYVSPVRVGDPFQIASNLLPNEEVSGYE